MNKTEVSKWGKYFDARDLGFGVLAAAKKAHISPTLAWGFERGDMTSTGLNAAAELGRTMVAGEAVPLPLSPYAVEALKDFGVFRRRYMGRDSMPWQIEAANAVQALIESDDREYCVMNEPPGSGKSTLFTHDIPCWLIARNRAIRIQIGSRTERQARMYVGRIKRTLERDVPLRAKHADLIKGVAHDAYATMQDDFGAFKPEGRSEVWRAESLTVRQTDGTTLDDKEPTVSAWGQDSGFLGGRFDFVVWDDLIDTKNMGTEESRDGLKDWYDSEAENRIDQGCTMLLQGQRIANNDLYKYALNKVSLDGAKKYKHVKFKAHYDELCTQDHGPDALPYPDGCLLDPYRLPWKFLEEIRQANPRAFELVYQQSDAAGGDNALIQDVWLAGGVDTHGYPSPGCYDLTRDLNEVPEHLADQDRDTWCFITVDPSPTEYWAIGHWLFDAVTSNCLMLNLIRERMNPEAFLSLDYDTLEWSGLLWEMYGLSNDLGTPLQCVVFEQNAAQRWFLSMPSTQRFQLYTGIPVVPHTTGINKKDMKFGLESIGEWFRQGMIRLPSGSDAARKQVKYLTDEAIQYPDTDTDDTLLTTWFAKLATENHYAPKQTGRYRMPGRPAWLANAQRGIA